MANYDEPIEETFTSWHNPLDVEQCVDIREGENPRPRRYKFPPGQTVQVPARFDRVIHTVHNGVIIGGQAPQLVKVGSDEQLDPALDTEKSKKREAQIEAGRAAIAKREAEEAEATAAAKAAEAEAKLAAQAEAKADAKAKADAAKAAEAEKPKKV